MNNSALVLYSGGQDSTTCLYWAKDRFERVMALNISYGQRHSIEIESAKKICGMTDVELINFELDVFTKIGDSGLLNKHADISDNHRVGDLPASFVPGRNILMLTVAAIIAFKHGVSDIITGVCQTDYSGYPDCRKSTIECLETTLCLGMDYGFNIETPLMFMTKAETVKLSMGLPGCMEALAYSHTCYEGMYPPCGACPACKLRAKGFEEAGVEDPIIRRAKIENLL